MNINNSLNTTIKYFLDFDMSISTTVLCFAFTLVFALVIYFSYKVAVNKEFYSKDFNISLAIITFICCALVLTAQSSLITALGIAGSLSIIRFRTAIKSVLDLTFTFWAASVGIICGYQTYVLALILSFFIIIVLFGLKLFDIPSNLGLIIIHTKDLNKSNEIIEHLKKETSFLRLKNKSVSKDSVELVLEYKTKDQQKLEEILSNNSSIDNFSILNYDRETRF